MKEFTIQPSDHSDADVSDEENWCTTTDTSIHSDLGSFLEDMALHEGDVTDYDSVSRRAQRRKLLSIEIVHKVNMNIEVVGSNSLAKLPSIIGVSVFQ